MFVSLSYLQNKSRNSHLLQIKIFNFKPNQTFSKSNSKSKASNQIKFSLVFYIPPRPEKDAIAAQLLYRHVLVTLLWQVSLVDRRGYLTVSLQLEGEDNIVLRRAENMREWWVAERRVTNFHRTTLCTRYNLLERAVQESKARVMASAEQFWAVKAGGEAGERDVSNIALSWDHASLHVQLEDWLLGRARIAALYSYSGPAGPPDRPERPASVASVDRRRGKQRRRARSQSELNCVLFPHTAVEFTVY